MAESDANERDKRLRQLENQVKELTARLQVIYGLVRSTSNNDEANHYALLDANSKIEALAQAFSDLTWKRYLQIDRKQTPIVRYIPVRMYVAIEFEEIFKRLRADLPSREFVDAPFFDLLSSVSLILAEIDFEIPFSFRAEIGSWFKRMIARSRGAITSSQVTNRLRLVEEALMAQQLDKPKAEGTELLARAAASLITALQNTPSASIQVGDLLVVKGSDQDGNPQVLARTLDPRLLRTIEEDNDLQKNPAALLALMNKSGQQ